MGTDIRDLAFQKSEWGILEVRHLDSISLKTGLPSLHPDLTWRHKLEHRGIVKDHASQVFVLRPQERHWGNKRTELVFFPFPVCFFCIPLVPANSW